MEPRSSRKKKKDITTSNPNKKPFYKRPLMMIALAASILLLGTLCYAGYLAVKANSALGNITSGVSDDDGLHLTPQPIDPDLDEDEEKNPPIFDPADLDTDKRKHDSITFLLIGVDSRPNAGGLNTDVMIFGSLNLESNSLSLFSMPRDTLLKPVGLANQKANAYYAYYYMKDRTTASAISGSKEFFSDLLRFPIDHVAVLNFKGVEKLVDAVGGLDLYVDQNMRYTDSHDNTDINLKKGQQVLYGKDTLDFVRYRQSNHGTPQSSDIARNERQQQVISKMLEKIASFNGVTQLGNLIDIAGNSLRTDASEEQIKSWVFNFKNMLPKSVNMLKVESHWKSPYIALEKDQLNEAINTLREEAGLSRIEGLDLSPSVHTFSQQ